MNIANELDKKMILSEEEIYRLIQAKGTEFDYDSVLDLMEEIKKSFPLEDGEKEKFPRHYYIPWLCRELYLMGFLDGLKTGNRRLADKSEEIGKNKLEK